MIQPEQIQEKAKKLYPKFLLAWLEGNEAFFPCDIPSDKSRDKNITVAMKEYKNLIDGSEKILGYGYTVECVEVNFRDIGRNPDVKRIQFKKQEGFLQLLKKQREFAAFAKAVNEIRLVTPKLEEWLRSDWKRLLKVARDIDGLLHVVRYFQANPRPNLYRRQLPLPVDTKFIDRHETLLREWLDLILPPSAIVYHDEENFDRRFGLRYSGSQILVRLLDPQLERELAFPCSEFSLPLQTLGELRIDRTTTTFIVENGTNLLMLSPMSRTLAIGRMGDAVTLMHYIPWLSKTPIIYWGDLDVEGFEILSSLRAIFPHVRSVFMDIDTFDHWPKTTGKGAQREVPHHLTEVERLAYLHCRDKNLRGEQEKLPQTVVNAMIDELKNATGEMTS